MLEDDGGFALAPYGETVLPTPHLSRLAACGSTFERAFTSVSSCSPSRASLLSGLPTHESGMYGLCQGKDHFSAVSGIDTLPNLLNAAGVATGIQGKYHVWGSPDDGASAFRFAWGNSPTGPGGCQAGASYACPNTDYNFVSRNISNMRDQVRAFWQWAGSAPAFMYVGFGDSHRCGGALGSFCELYGRDAQGKSTIPDWAPFVPAPEAVDLPFWVQDTPAARLDYSHMLTAKNRLDQGVGLLLDELSRTPYANTTMIVYFGASLWARRSGRMPARAAPPALTAAKPPPPTAFSRSGQWRALCARQNHVLRGGHGRAPHHLPPRRPRRRAHRGGGLGAGPGAHGAGLAGRAAAQAHAGALPAP